MLIGILTDAREASKVAPRKTVFELWSLDLGLFHESRTKAVGVNKTIKVPRPKGQDQSSKTVFLKQNASAQYALPLLIASGAPGLWKGRVQLLPRHVQELQALGGAKEQFAL